MNTKICKKCGKNKPFEEFSISRRRKDGLQPNCKSCNKKFNDKYRAENKEYWSYETGYFSDKSKWEYIKLKQKADKTIKCYRIEVDGKYYIGVTKAPLYVRMNLHINQHRGMLEGRDYASARSLPKLWEATKHLTRDEWVEIVKNAKILEETTGSRTKMYTIEKKWIRQHLDEGKELLNSYDYRSKK